MNIEIDSRMTLRLERVAAGLGRVAAAQKMQIDELVDLILDSVLADPKLLQAIFGEEETT